MSCFSGSSHPPFLIQQSLARLFNALASTASGRSYLANQPNLVDTIVSCLVQRSRQMEVVTVEMLVATLQKLSLKYINITLYRIEPNI